MCWGVILVVLRVSSRYAQLSRAEEITVMQVRATISPSELQEAIRMSRSRYFWLRFFAANWYATLICLVVIGVAVNALVHNEHPKWRAMAIMFAIGSFFIGWSWYRSNRGSSAGAKALSARSGTVSLDADGIRTILTSGASTFIPWSSYAKWKEGKSVFLLTGSEGLAILPIEEGSRDAVRGILSSKVS
jgi:hypothetical protein